MLICRTKFTEVFFKTQQWIIKHECEIEQGGLYGKFWRKEKKEENYEIF